MSASPGGRRVVIALCGSEKKHRQSFDRLRQYVESRREVGVGNGTANGGNGNGSGNGSSSSSGIIATSCDAAAVATANVISFSIVKLCYDDNSNKLFTETGVDEDVDVVLHKISTLPSKAAVALKEWCVVTSRKRLQKQLSPVIIIDPMESTRLVLQRSFVCKLFDGRLRRPLCLTLRSWLWTRNSDDAMMPLGISSFVLGDAIACEVPHSSSMWRIMKPDLSTGPPHTHHMVVWKGSSDPETPVPEKVQRLLPKEFDTFVLQGFLISSIPVVIKVYCIGTSVFVKAVSTTPLLRKILAGAGEPVFVDSQVKYPDEEGWKEQEKNWKSFLAEGGRMYTTCSQISSHIAEELHLSLFGFDLLLVPHHLSRHDSFLLDAAAIATPEMIQTTSTTTNGISSILHEENLFDKTTGTPTPLLSSAVPVLVDVNYFPGFSGIENASESLLEVITSKVMGISVTETRQTSHKKLSTCGCC
ncbi:uncharacterized protein TM35_000152730 [Trypanosoma theileri]|uniref:Uncharacterized protein n=1 Tax=Trypanosoma theileri TaxID=67003 RepID=A0A1X0NVY7_9TRYP|nr:uncharacterized protein TM35_000152730 [Trypanosoma theileri]ORC88842.1 hypothetical protein TM35_000152730 [Trypanosoma theileri]